MTIADAAPTRRVAVRWIGLLLATVVLIEGLSMALLALAGALHMEFTPIDPTRLTPEDRQTVEQFTRDQGTYVIHSPTLGWTHRPNGVSALGYRANAQGIRGDRTYARTPPTDRIRIAAFGDSHVHCDDVGNPDTWEAALERIDPTLEVLNFGVGGYGPDQGYLRFQEEGRAFQPDIVVIGYMAENINRVVSVFRSFYQPASPLSKPRFLLDGDDLTLVANPLPTRTDYERLLASPAAVLPQLGEHDYWYQTMPHAGPFDWLATVRLLKNALYLYRRGIGPTAIIGPNRVYRPGTEALQVVERVLTNFAVDARAAGALPIVVLFPSHSDILRHQPATPKRYQPLIDHLEAHDVRYIDLLDAFHAAEGQYERGPIDGHFTPIENLIVARAVRAYLENHQLTTRAAVRAARDAPPSATPRP